MPIKKKWRAWVSLGVLMASISFGGEKEDILFNAIRNSKGKPDGPPNLEEVRRAIENGANVRFVEPKYGNTALHLAVKLKNNHRMIQFLLSRGAKLDLPSRKGFTPLKLAEMNGYTLSEIEALLNDHEAKVSVKAPLKTLSETNVDLA